MTSPAISRSEGAETDAPEALVGLITERGTRIDLSSMAQKSTDESSKKMSAGVGKSHRLPRPDISMLNVRGVDIGPNDMDISGRGNR
jgi:hypothetical protein